jgi:hypothetical protein
MNSFITSPGTRLRFGIAGLLLTLLWVSVMAAWTDQALTDASFSTGSV